MISDVEGLFVYPLAIGKSSFIPQSFFFSNSLIFNQVYQDTIYIE